MAVINSSTPADVIVTEGVPAQAFLKDADTIADITGAGTAATKDHGAAAGEVPLNSDLGTVRTLNASTGATDATAANLVRNDHLAARGVSATEGSQQAHSLTGSGLTVIVRDTLRASIEAASGGRMTVLYNDQGVASHMFIVPKFNIADVLSEGSQDFGPVLTPHPAFFVNTVAKNEIFIGAYPGCTVSNRLVSVPGVDATVSQNFDTFRTRSFANGSGWHLMTNWEWAAVTLWVLKQVEDEHLASQPRGNTQSGRAHDHQSETGVQIAGAVPGSGTRILTGSGPAGWRHNGELIGISDLVGNVWEWIDGLKIIDGRIYMPADNNWPVNETENATAPDTTTWTATDVYAQNDSGALKLHNAAGSVDASINTLWATVPLTAGYDGLAAATRQMMVQALIAPSLMDATADPYTTHALGRFYANTSGERLPRRGGSWNAGSLAGLGTLSLGLDRGDVGSNFGARPCYIAP